MGWLPESLERSPFHRYVNRMCLVSAVVGLVPLWRRLEGRSFGGIREFFPRLNWRDYGRGWLLGFLSLAVLALAVVAAGGRGIQGAVETSRLLSHFWNAGIAALVVGFLEEVLFRGVLFFGLQRQYSFATAAGLSSAIYALVHFFRRPTPPPAVEWWTGFQTLASMAQGFFDLGTFLPAFPNLFLAGVILAMMFRVTGTLWFSAGLHGGWIFWLKTYGHLTVPTVIGRDWLYGTNRLIDGWLGTALLCGVGVFCWRRWGQNSSLFPGSQSRISSGNS